MLRLTPTLAALLLAFCASSGIWAVEKSVDLAENATSLLKRHCLACHGPERQESSFRVDRRKSLLEGGDTGEPAVVPGESAKSNLISFVSRADEATAMPPKGKGEVLKNDEIALLQKWIDQGAKMPEEESVEEKLTTKHWSFQPLVRPNVPRVENKSPANPIDAFILSRLHVNGLTPSPPADKATLIRRLYLDMLGLFPSPEDVKTFVSDDSPNAYAQLVERVLKSEHYGERWARHWLDIVRFAESNGFETNYERPNAYHYRDWLIRAFNDDMPYDQFVFRQLAGDSVSDDAATGFLVGGAYDAVKSPDPLLTAMQRQDELADMVNATGTAFLGVTIGCARCHSHKFDPILQKDYYSLQAVFCGVQHGERELRGANDQKNSHRLAIVEKQLEEAKKELADFGVLPPVNARENEERFPAVEAKFIRFTIEATNSSEPCIDELEIWTSGAEPHNVALASAGAKPTSSGTYPDNSKHKLEHINDGQYGNDRSWISNTAGTGWVQIELSQPVTIARIVWGRDRKQVFADRLPTAYRVEVAIEEGQWQVVADSKRRLTFGTVINAEAFRASGLDAARAEHAAKLAKHVVSLEAEREQFKAKPLVYAGRFASPPAIYRLYRGDPMAPREQVVPEALSVLHEQVGSLNLSATAGEQERRVAFARWIASSRNPLTPRVAVNRLWHYHFGRGLVSTPSDFGLMGAKPSHPEMLDWLAAELLEPSQSLNGVPSRPWSLKHIHRLILLSKTYQQASTPRPEAMTVDKDTALLWRFPPRRIEAEAIRDNILLVSGALDRRMFGPGFMLFHPNTNYSRNWLPKDEFGPAEFCRMIYALDLRMKHDAVFGQFDCPDGGQATPQRSRSTTPLQALNLLNSLFVAQQARIAAERLLKECPENPSQQVRRIYELAFGRTPTEDEFSEAIALVKEHGLESLCRAVFNANEFLHMP